MNESKLRETSRGVLFWAGLSSLFLKNQSYFMGNPVRQMLFNTDRIRGADKTTPCDLTSKAYKQLY